MKYSTIALIAFSGLAAAQSTLPVCSQKCIADSVAANTKCGASDLNCQCEDANKSAIQAGATTCVIAACGADQALAVLSAANAACAALPPAGASTTAAATTSAAAASTTAAAASSTTAAASSSSAAAGYGSSSSAAAASSSSTIKTSASAAPTASSNGTAVAPTPTPTQFPGTAAQVAVSFGSIFAAGMAILAAF